MDCTERLTNVAILGAAGKMGRGITLLVAMEMARLNLLPENRDKVFVLHAIDKSPEELKGLRHYLKQQVQRWAERNIVQLRKMYAFREDLIENEEIVEQYLWEVSNNISFSTSTSGNLSAGCIFEAVSENPNLKVTLMKHFKECSKQSPVFFTNTSSIPISELDQKAGLNGYLVGLHFYNPPAVQKLVEIASAQTTRPEITQMAFDIAKALGKKAVVSADVPGFIGNGHFMREIIYSTNLVDKLAEERPVSHAVCLTNIVTADFMIRPMGIFQLIDYVGIDVCRHILQVMEPHFTDEQMNSRLLDLFFDKGIVGGQYPDGTQKPGFFKYAKGKIIEVFDLNKNEYVNMEPIENFCRMQLKPLPESFKPWKVMVSHPDRKNYLKTYFNDLQQLNSMGGNLAVDFLNQSRRIAQKLLEYGVAKSEDDINTVLKKGFFHAYGPLNDYIK